MPEFARKYIWLGAAGGFLQFTLIALIAFSGSDEPTSRQPDHPVAAESKTAEMSSGAPSTGPVLRDVSSTPRQTQEPIDPAPQQAEAAGPSDVDSAGPSATQSDEPASGIDRPESPTAPSDEQDATAGMDDKPQPGAPSEPPAEAEPAPEGEAAPPSESTRAPINLNAASTEDLIREVFKEEGDKAIQVARCESELKTDARRGQFLGLFQMGANERARYGHGQDAPAQIEAAYQLFMARGWQPWTCA